MTAEVAGMNKADGDGVLTLAGPDFTDIRITGILIILHP